MKYACIWVRPFTHKVEDLRYSHILSMLEDKSKKRKTNFEDTNIQQDYVAILQYSTSKSANHFSFNAFSSTFISTHQIKAWYRRKHCCPLMIFFRINVIRSFTTSISNLMTFCHKKLLNCLQRLNIFRFYQK